MKNRRDQEQGFCIPVDWMDITTDGKRLISSGADLRVWDLALGRQCRFIPWNSDLRFWLRLSSRSAYD